MSLVNYKAYSSSAVRCHSDSGVSYRRLRIRESEAFPGVNEIMCEGGKRPMTEAFWESRVVVGNKAGSFLTPRVPDSTQS